jgi:hypothetical protein
MWELYQMGERTTTWAASDQKTVVFYGTLLVMVILDLILLFWIFHPFTHFGTAAFPAQPVSGVSDASKPSPFDLTAAKAGPVKRATRARSTQARASGPPVLNASF